jgi:hypothetical protein
MIMNRTRVFILTKYVEGKLESVVGAFQFIEDAVETMTEFNKSADVNITFKIESHVIGELNPITTF